MRGRCEYVVRDLGLVQLYPCSQIPGVGPLLWGALLQQDMYLAGTIVLLLSTLTVIGTLISDILLVILDPRIRLEGRR